MLAQDPALALDPALEFPTDNATAAAEGYVLEVDGGVRVSARTAAGVYWGIRSLLQMLSASTTLPGGTAVDWPNYPVRCFMLDVGRRFANLAELHGGLGGSLSADVPVLHLPRVL